MLDDSIIDGRIMFRLASASLFKYLPDKICEINAFYRLRLPEVVDVVLSRCAGRDRL